MNGTFFLIIPVLLPILAGIGVGLIPLFRQKKPCRIWTGIFLTGSSACMLFTAFRLSGHQLILWHLTDSLPVFLHLDSDDHHRKPLLHFHKALKCLYYMFSLKKE